MPPQFQRRLIRSIGSIWLRCLGTSADSHEDRNVLRAMFRNRFPKTFPPPLCHLEGIAYLEADMSLCDVSCLSGNGINRNKSIEGVMNPPPSAHIWCCFPCLPSGPSRLVDIGGGAKRLYTDPRNLQSRLDGFNVGLNGHSGPSTQLHVQICIIAHKCASAFLQIFTCAFLR